MQTHQQIHFPRQIPAGIESSQQEDVNLSFWHLLHLFKKHSNQFKNSTLLLSNDATPIHAWIQKRSLKKNIDVMLEKKAGVRKIHLLHIIGLVQADFNTAFKLYFAKHQVSSSEKIKLIEEQRGG